MSKESKIKNRKGSAMVLVIIAMSLFMIVSITIMSQINNQIKSNSKIYEETKYKYEAEGEIDKNASEIYKNLKQFIDSTNSKCSKKQPLQSNETRVLIEPKERQGINCYTNGDKFIKANIYNVYKEVYENQKQTKVLIRTEIDSFDIEEFKNLEMMAIVEGKYNVTNKIEFSIDDSFNLTYKIKSYNKGWIK